MKQLKKGDNLIGVDTKVVLFFNDGLFKW